MEVSAIDLSDVRIIVTGGAGGIGAAVARHLAEGGASVLIADVATDVGEALAHELGERTAFCRLDVTSEADWAAAVATAVRRFGGVTALLNNAGIGHYADLVDTTAEQFRRVMEVNLVGAFLGLRAVAPVMVSGGGGAIINMSSVTGMQGYAGLGAYSTSKWAVRGLTKNAALELGADGIRVFSIHPGPIRSTMTSDVSEYMARQQPIARIGEAVEVARMVRFLLTDATFSTGSEFVIDGGGLAGKLAIRDPAR